MKKYLDFISNIHLHKHYQDALRKCINNIVTHRTYQIGDYGHHQGARGGVAGHFREGGHDVAKHQVQHPGVQIIKHGKLSPYPGGQAGLLYIDK